MVPSHLNCLKLYPLLSLQHADRDDANGPGMTNEQPIPLDGTRSQDKGYVDLDYIRSLHELMMTMMIFWLCRAM